MEVWPANDWPFWSLELVGYKTIDGCAINAVWSSSRMTTLWTLCSSSIWMSLWIEGLSTIWRTRNFSTCQLPPYSFVVSLDDGRNNDGLHSIWQGFVDSIHIALNAFHVTYLVVATCHSFIGWMCEWGFFDFPALTSCLSLQNLSSPFWPFVFSKFLSSFSTFSDKFLLIFSLFMVDYATVRLDSPLVSFFFARLGVFLSLLVAIVLRWGSFCLKILFLG